MWPQLLPYSKCCEQSASRVGEGRREGFGLCRWRSEDNLQICSVPVKMRWMSSFTCCDHSYLIGCKWRKAGRGLRTRLLFGHIFRWRLGTNQSRLRTCRKHLSFQNFMYILTYCSYLTHLSTCSVRDILSFSCHLLIIFSIPFFLHVTALWNTLSSGLTSAPSLSVFKKLYSFLCIMHVKTLAQVAVASREPSNSE